MTRANRKTAIGISLFPFLAVLLCTMGSLVMLLVLLMKQARANAVDANRDRMQQVTKEQSERNEKLRLQVEDETWRAEVLEGQRQELQQQITDRRQQLAHLEQHIRDLDAQWKSLQAQAAEIAQLRESKSTDVQPLEDEKQRIAEQLASAQQQLEQARQEVSQAPRCYAIIPYPGPNGTLRRPIYIECTERGVILQPENIVLTVEDFQEPLGPGNPLDAAIRTIQTHQKRAFAQERSESYPLLIVRPDGVAAYAAARAAMSTWEDEFGYELVDQEMQLSYPAPDPGLSTSLQEAIQAARQRQEIRRQAMPASRSTAFVVSPYHGGLQSLGGDDVDAEIGNGPGLGIGSGNGGTAATGAAASAKQPSQGANGSSREGSSATGRAASGAQSNNSAAGNGTAAGASGGPGGPNANGSGLGGGFGFSQALAGSRGADWALHKKMAGATGYRRPVRVICREDALILVPEALSNDKPKVFRFDDDATTTIDEFVKSLHQRMELWGLPPVNGFWKPQLLVAIEANGEARYELLEQLLHNSGLELKRETR